MKPKVEPVAATLRKKLANVTHLTRESEVAKSKVASAISDYNLYLQQSLLEANAPIGFGWDIFGDGKLKPVAECAKDPSTAPAPAKPV